MKNIPKLLSSRGAGKRVEMPYGENLLSKSCNSRGENLLSTKITQKKQEKEERRKREKKEEESEACWNRRHLQRARDVPPRKRERKREKEREKERERDIELRL